MCSDKGGYIPLVCGFVELFTVEDGHRLTNSLFFVDTPTLRDTTGPNGGGRKTSSPSTHPTEARCKPRKPAHMHPHPFFQEQRPRQHAAATQRQRNIALPTQGTYPSNCLYRTVSWTHSHDSVGISSNITLDSYLIASPTVNPHKTQKRREKWR